MNHSKYFNFAIAGVVLAGACTLVTGDLREEYMKWKVHDLDRPQPPVVDPGYAGTQEKPGKAPSDAIVLFDGTGMDAFNIGQGESIGWRITEDGALSTVPKEEGGKGKSSAKTTQAFGDIQLHVEWRTPMSQDGRKGQGRGNSGIFLMGKYEVQVLDNKGNDTYPDGMAGSLYGQQPPLVNAGRGLDQWQSYDLIFRRPHFNEDGSIKKSARITVLHNGVLVQDNLEILGPSKHKQRTKYVAHADKLPITFQNHQREEAHYRNIWVRELEPRIE